MIPETFVWLVWSSAFLVPWLAAFIAFPRHRKAMIWASVFTMPFGLSLFNMPVEELPFAIAFGAYWSGVYEHFTWKSVVMVPQHHKTSAIAQS